MVEFVKICLRVSEYLPPERAFPAFHVRPMGILLTKFILKLIEKKKLAARATPDWISINITSLLT